MTQFDPYHKWLAIPPADQPPNYYRLLGIQDFENDPSIIEAAADQRIDFVQRMAKAEQAAAAHKVLTELSTARICLLSENKKSVYDDALRTPSSAFSNPLLDSDEPIGLVEIDDEEDLNRHVDSDDSDEWGESGGTYELNHAGTDETSSRPQVLYEPIDESESDVEILDEPGDVGLDPDDDLASDDLFDALMGNSGGPSPSRSKKKRRGSRTSPAKKSSPTKPTRKEDEVDFVYWKDQQRHVRELIAAKNFEQAKSVLDNMVAQTHPHLHQYVGWANRKFKEIESGNITTTKTSIDLGDWVDLVHWKDQQRQVRKLLLENNFDNATELLDEMAAQTHPKLHRYVGWANRKLSEISSGDVRHTGTSIDVNTLVDLNHWQEQQKIIRVLIKTRELDEAAQHLKTMASQTNPKLHQYVGWANRKLSEIQR